MIPNPFFDNDMTGWTVSSGQGTTAVSPSPIGGSKSFSNAVNQAPWVSSDTRIPVNPHWTYEVRGSFRRQNLNGSAGGIYLAVRLFDSTGATIGGDGTWWYYPAAFVQFTDVLWHTYSAKFGSSTGRPFPANARTMTVGAILNYDGNVAGNRNFEVTALQIAPTGRPPIYATDVRPVAATCPPVGPYVAGTTVLVTTGNITLDRPAWVHITGNIISNTSGRRDTSLRIDGATVNSALIRTEVIEWGNHTHQWSGQLSAGVHVVTVVAETNISLAAHGYGCGPTWGNLTVAFMD